MTLGKLPLLRVRLSVRKTGEKRAQLLVGKRALAKKLPLSAFNSEIREAFEGLAPDQDVICLPDEHPIRQPFVRRRRHNKPNA
jgi:hypothetical protein